MNERIKNHEPIGSSEQGSMVSDEELRESLTPEQYYVTQQCGTERPFLNAYWDNKEPGIYVDLISGDPLFSSKDKFDSGTGWPSFTSTLNEECIKEVTDESYGMIRKEVRSRKGDAHLGHLFDDGPAPTNLRYCINSASLRFIPAHKLEEEGYGAYGSLFDETAPNTEVASFGAGCFWGVEAAFQKVSGVVDTAVGYMGGDLEDPSYREVCSGRTGHAEVVHVTYDPSRVSYEQLLEVFWKIHNPTTLNRQGPDLGSQYRSVVFFHTEAQKEVALNSKKKLEQSGRFNDEIVTEISQAKPFYRAEEYHQRYVEKHGGSACPTHLGQ